MHSLCFWMAISAWKHKKILIIARFSISGFTFEVQKLYVYLSHIVRQMLFWPLLGIAIAASRARWAQVGWKIVKWNSHMLFSQNCSFVLTADTPFDVFVYTPKWNFLRYVICIYKKRKVLQPKSNFFIYFEFNFQL